MDVVAGGVANAEFITNAQHALLVDYDSGEVLFCKACTEPMPPSSMSKLMTVEVVFQRLKDGRLKPEDTFHVSEGAWRQGQKTNESKMWVAVNSDISVDNLLKGIIVQSGGDACVVVAEAIGGTEAAFAEMETARGKEIDLGYREFKAYQLLAAGDAVGEAELWHGQKKKVALTVKDPVRVLMPVNGRKDMKVTLRYDGPLRAPIAAGQQVGTITVAVPGKPDKVVPVVSAETIGGSGFLDNMMMGLQALIFGTKEV